MKRSLLLLVAVVAMLAVAAAGCGGSQSVPANAVAVVDGTEISSTELDALMEQAKASYKTNKRDFPNVGTPEYQSIQQQYVAFLVQKTQFEKAAEDLGIEINDSDIEKTRDQLKKDRFDGNEQKLKDALEENGLTEDTFRQTLRVSILSEKLFKAVTKDVKVTDTEALQAFTQSPEQFGAKPESREVRHILISEKDANGQVDYVKSKAKADDVYAQLKSGADFETLVAEVLDGHGLEGERRQVHGEPRPERPRVRRGRIQAEDEPDLAAGEDPVRLPHHRAAHESHAGDVVRGRQGRGQGLAAAAEAQRDDDDVGRGPAEAVQEQGQLRHRLRASGAPGDHADRDPVTSSGCPSRRRFSTSRS